MVVPVTLAIVMFGVGIACGALAGYCAGRCDRADEVIARIDAEIAKCQEELEAEYEKQTGVK